jgi:two-component system, NtrC family, sensor histidine kinase HydH
MRLVEAEVAKLKSKWSFTAEDVAWIILFIILVLCQEDVSYQASILLICFAIFQVLEPKLDFFQAPKGRIAGPLIKMILCYGLVGWAHAINSNFYVIFLLPIISAATVLNFAGAVSFIVLACLAYSSFLLFIDWQEAYLPAADIRMLCLRTAFFPVVGLAVYQQARAKREEMTRTKAAAAQLEESNRNLRKTQASLRRSERLAALGQLTAGLAHELRNPLGTIKASSELLLKPATLQKPEVVTELSSYIVSEVDRTSALVSRFLDFARPLQLHANKGDLRETVARSAAQVHAQAEEKQIHVETHLPQTPAEFTFDDALLSLALTNLLQNAIDASESGRTVRVTLDELNHDARISVVDQGSGIAPEHIESVFNPFFTTKTSGTGLGLALVAKIIDEHQGKITVTSDLGRGTRFEILLPNTVEA